MALATKPNNRHSDAAKELDYNRYIRENLTAAERMNYAIQEYAPPLMMGTGLLALAAPGLFEISASIGVSAFGAFAATRQEHAWPLSRPAFVCKATPLHKKLFKLQQAPVVRDIFGVVKKVTPLKHVPILGNLLFLKDPKEMMGDGIMLLGSDMDNGGAQIWSSMDLLVRHLLLIGTTGSGKTQAILGMIAQLMAQGSGGIFCDGKADITTWFMLYTLARHFGLERQLLVINYLTSGGANTKRSNTTNIFEIASADSLSEMVSSMMGGGSGGGNDDMWRGRAEALFGLIIRAACEDRDLRSETIVADDLRRRMTLQKLIELPQNMIYSQRVRDEAQLFLNDLPGYSAWQKATQPQAKETSMGRMSEQLGFLQMQFTRVLSLLSGTYGYITGTDISEIDWIDVINQRRTVYIMLPALEKSPESLKQLGRMVVTSMRNAMLPIIGGGQLTGLKKILIDGRPIGKQIPYGLFLDEYGSYCVEGFGDVVAQIRSMGVFACFSGQDWASFKKGSEVEADRVNANTSTKIFLKTFDVNTVKLLVDTCGKKLVSVAGTWGDRPNGGRPDMRTNFQSVDALQVQEVDRARIDQMASQDPGMAHIYFGGKLWTKVKMFYPAIQQSSQSQVNSFVRMRTPVGVSGIVEDAERLIAMRKHLDKIQEAVKTYLPTTEPAVIDLGDEFHLWCKNAIEGSQARGGELFSSMQKAAEQIFKGDRKGTPGLAYPQPVPSKPAVATASQPSKTAPPAAAVDAGDGKGDFAKSDSLDLLEKALSQQPAVAPSQPLFTFDESLLPELPISVAPAPQAEVKIKDEQPLIHPADFSFSMDDHAPDTATQAMISRTALSAAVMQEVKQMQQTGGDSQWSGTLPEARLSANTVVQNAMPDDPNNSYPESPVPKNFSANSLRGALSDLKGKMTDSLKTTGQASTTGEKEEQQ